MIELKKYIPIMIEFWQVWESKIVNILRLWIIGCDLWKKFFVIYSLLVAIATHFWKKSLYVIDAGEEDH